MSGMGMALMGTAVAEGEDRACQAARSAISSPLLEDATIQGARGVLINVTGAQDMTLHEVCEASRIIQESAHPEANIIFGSVFDDQMGELHQDHRDCHRLHGRVEPEKTVRSMRMSRDLHSGRGQVVTVTEGGSRGGQKSAPKRSDCNPELEDPYLYP